MTANHYIRNAEGYSLTPYRDTLGNWTIGRGHKLTDYAMTRALDTAGAEDLSNIRITPNLAEAMFLLDLGVAQAAVRAYLGAELAKEYIDQSSPRYAGLLSMAFQLGRAGLESFSRMRAAITVHNWEAAARAALDSQWSQQTPSRAHECARMMATNQWGEHHAA